MPTTRPVEDFEEYRLIQPLGRGGMGEVYLARDGLLDRLVAIKLIAGPKPSAILRDRFLIEARAAARIQHPNVVAIHRVAEHLGRPYLVSEFVRGESLDKLVKPMPWSRALELGIGMARGLAAAHRRGVLHRDLKPANAMLAEDGTVKLLDFGLAKLLEGDPGPGGRAGTSPHGVAALASVGEDDTIALPVLRAAATVGAAPPEITQHGVVLGTPHYLPPERWLGEPATKPSDIYSFGAVLYELCAGRTPHADVPFAELARVATEEDARPLAEAAPGVDPGFAAVIDRCLRREPGKRFSSAEELREALEALTPEARGRAIPQGNPYRGLLPFEAEHASLFFGRASESRAVLERLRSDGFVLVAGDSGVGKSSLCRAGILPRIVLGELGSQRVWSVATIVPGRHPLAALSGAMAAHLRADEVDISRQLTGELTGVGRELTRRQGDKRGLVLFIDQLEELLTLSDPTEAAAVAEFLSHLASPPPGFRVLATVRGDFLTRLATFASLREELPRALYLLSPLGRGALYDAITGPIRATGLRFEPDQLIDELVESSRQMDGGLPLLQFGLAELWEARDRGRGVISRASLEAIGGIAGALARHADRVLAGLPPPRREAVRRILRRLVTPEGTRTRRSEAELATDDDGRGALDALVRGRLVTAREADEGPAYEIAHEALLEGWDTLRGWLDDDHDARLTHARLEAAAVEWRRLGKSRDVLWSARQLAELEGVDLGGLGPTEAEFLAISHTTLARRRLRRRALQVGVVLLVVATYAVVRFNASAEARDRARQLSDQIDRRLASAQALVGQAEQGRGALEDARARAFAAFRQNLTKGEQPWRRARELADEYEASYRKAELVLNEALTLDARRADVQALLGKVLFARARLAERDHHPDKVDELLGRMGQHDPSGNLQAAWTAPAHLALSSDPPLATVVVERYQVDAHKQRVPSKVLTVNLAPPLTELALPPGSYRLTVTAPDYVEVRDPIVLERAEQRSVRLSLPTARQVPPGYVYVPPGRSQFGAESDDDEARKSFFFTAPIHGEETRGFLIAQHETTFGDWFEYLAALPARERRRRLPHGGGTWGVMDVSGVAGAYRLSMAPMSRTRPYEVRQGQALHYDGDTAARGHDWSRFPVSGIGFDDAVAYAAWLRQTRRVPGARLCSDIEWERAARGADDRRFPHADVLSPGDANYTEEPDVESKGPVEVGSYPRSRSPFEVDDMVGNVWEWVTSSIADEHTGAVRGGGFSFDALTCRSDNRQPGMGSARGLYVGLRICADDPLTSDAGP